MKNKEGKKEEVLVQYPKCCVKCLYVNFCRENGNRLSETKFRQLVPKNIKPSRKATDLCPYCEDLPKINKRKRDLIEEIESSNPSNNLNDLNESFQKLDQYEIVINNHRNRNDLQRKAFEEGIEKLKEAEGMIVMDFKENIKLGPRPREVSSDYYSNSQRTILCMLVITRNHNFNYFDFISEDLTHDASFVINCLNKLFTLDEFKNLNITSLSIWSDGGKHFRNFELIQSYININSCIENKLTILDFNYFIEYHGKSYCDSHFSTLSNIIKRYTTNESRIESTSNLIEILTNRLDNYDLVNSGNKRRKIKSKTKVCEISNVIRTENYEICHFDKFQVFYSFELIFDINSKSYNIFATLVKSDTNGKYLKSTTCSYKRENKVVKRAPPLLERPLKVSKCAWEKEVFRSKVSQRSLDQPSIYLQTELIEEGFVEQPVTQMEIDDPMIIDS